MAMQKFNISMPPETVKKVDSRGEIRSQIISRDLDRLYSLYQRALRQVDLSKSEMCLIVDSLNGTISDVRSASMLWAQIEDSCKLDDLDKKWDIDGAFLTEKLRNMNDIQCLAIVDAVERFCQDENRDLEQIEKYFWGGVVNA